MNKILQKYTNLSIPGAFSGLHSFKKSISNAKLNHIDTYTLHKETKNKFTRRKTLADGIDHIWQIDLIDLRKIKHVNSHYQYLLTCIDVFSRYAWVRPLKNKTSYECKAAFENIFKLGRQPKIIYSDWGNEFKGECSKYLNKLNIRIIETRSIYKASIVERFNKTLKNKMWRYFTFTKKKKYIHILDKLVQNYNNSYHTSIKTEPSKVNDTNEKKIYKLLYGDDDYTFIDFKFKKGDYVRLKKDKNLFEKGYTPSWSEEVYLISRIIPSNPPTYQIQTLDGREFEWKYYKEELQIVSSHEFPYDTYQVLKDNKDNIQVIKLNQ